MRDLDRLPEGDVWCVAAASDRLNAMMAVMPAVVSGEDVDAIRRMRVASRRLGTALSILGSQWAPAEIKSLERKVRRIRRILGDTRDLDVQMEAMSAFRETLGEKRLEPGITRLLLRLRQRQERTRPAVLKKLARVDEDGVLARFSEFFHRARIRHRMRDGKSDFAATRQVGFEALHLRLQALYSLAPFLKTPAASARQHRMRIEAKRLRYTMEIFSDLYDGSLGEFIHTTRVLQEHLGVLHDADVWIEGIPLFIEEERGKMAEYFGNTKSFSRLLPGLLYLQENQQGVRAEAYGQTLLFWKKMEEEAVLKRLESLLLQWNDGDKPTATEA